MEPATLTFIATALGSGLVTVANKILEKGVVDPALAKGLEPLRKFVTRGYDQKADEEKLRKAIEAAITHTGGMPTTSDITSYAWGTALEAIKANPQFATKVAAAALELTQPEAKHIHPTLLRELKVGKPDEFARFLFALRSELRKIESYRDVIVYTEQLAERNYLHGLYERVAAALGEGFVWVKPVPPNEKPYLEYWHRRWRTLSLLGRDTGEGMANRDEGDVKLDQVYVALNTDGARMTLKPEKETKKKESESESIETERETLSALRALVDTQRLVLLGDPGSGKSTFVQHVCLCLAGARAGNTAWLEPLQTKDLPKWELPAYFPLFVRLRDFAADEECLPPNAAQPGTAAPLLKFIKKQLAAEQFSALANQLDELLVDGEVLVVFDGLDEVTHPQRAQTPLNMPKADDDRRRQVAEAIEDFAHNRFYHARVIVTCRRKQYRAEGGGKFSWQLKGFPDYLLDDFNNAQIKQFITEWFKALQTRLQNAEAKGAELIRQVGQRADLIPLAPKPILLTQMALVHANSSLPDSRIELYKECADLLLWKWESLRGGQGGALSLSADDYISSLGIPNLRKDKLEAALYKAVFITHAKGHPDLLLETLREQLGQAVQSYEVAHPHVERVVWQFIEEWLHKRNGLIVPSTSTTFEFPHRSFREFMAGVVLATEGYNLEAEAENEDWEEIAPRLVKEDPTKWGEVFAFAAGYDKKNLKRLVEALEGLCDDETRPIPAAAPLYLLAGRVIRDADPTNFKDKRNRLQLYQRIEKGLIHLMRDTSEASAGDYPADTPHNPPTSPDLLTPQTRLDAGLLLDALGWTPIDLDDVIPINNKFAVAKYPVTNLQYQRFLEASDYVDESIWRSVMGFDEDGKPLPNVGAEAWQWFVKQNDPKYKPPYWDEARFGASHRLLPVITVTWYEAAAYCAWLEKHWREDEALREKLAKVFAGNFKVRLLSEAEWVAAAGGDKDSRYAWGKAEEFRPYMNTWESDLKGTSPVCMYPQGASPHGVLDLSGNVWEWQANKYNAKEEPSALRGGAWHDYGDLARVANRFRFNPDSRYFRFGFRVGFFPVY